jgi:hypothetical protein
MPAQLFAQNVPGSLIDTLTAGAAVTVTVIEFVLFTVEDPLRQGLFDVNVTVTTSLFTRRLVVKVALALDCFTTPFTFHW